MGSTSWARGFFGSSYFMPLGMAVPFASSVAIDLQGMSAMKFCVHAVEDINFEGSLKADFLLVRLFLRGGLHCSLHCQATDVSEQLVTTKLM